MTAQALIELSICICTCRRPAQLDELLQQLSQNLPPRSEIIVVDNDPAHSAREVLQQWTTRLPLKSQHLPLPNIASARNLTVRMASGKWIAFIDDDEQPCDSWAATLLATQSTCSADVIMAPVIPTYPPTAPDWLVAGGFFERPRFTTGTRITDKDARTGNALVRASLLQSTTTPFDPRYGLSGGEDTILFRQLHRNGAHFVWCDEAFVSELVPIDRLTPEWLLRRAYRYGQTSVYVELHMAPHATVRYLTAMRLGAKALVQGVISCSLAAVLLPVDRIRSFRWLRTAVSQLGKLSALMGRRYLEYAR